MLHSSMPASPPFSAQERRWWPWLGAYSSCSERSRRSRMPDARRDVEALAAGVASGDRLALARAITLVESDLVGDRELAEALVEAVLPRASDSLRVAVSGAPGVGKSTLIDAL